MSKGTRRTSAAGPYCSFDTSPVSWRCVPKFPRVSGQASTIKKKSIISKIKFLS